MTVAGSDSGGGAGIQADLKTITALGGFGMSAVTALTAQNTREVRSIIEVPADFVAAQIDVVAEDIGIDAAKTGMLASSEIIETVADRLRFHAIARLVVDPVMVSKSGDELLKPEAREALCRSLLPLAMLVTPNLSESETLSGKPVRSLAQMKEAAKRIREMGSEWVLIKGGHLPGQPVDLLFDGSQFWEVARPRVETKNTHGTGCTFSAAIATELGRGRSVPQAVETARDALQAALENALPFGGGHGPLGQGAMFQCGRQRPG